MELVPAFRHTSQISMMKLSAKPKDASTLRPLPLLWMHVVAIVLLGSYIAPGTHTWWQHADEFVFFSLNGTLDGRGIWEFFWSWANTRYADAFVGCMIILCLIYPVCTSRKEKIQAVFFQCIAMLIVLLSARTAFHFVADWLTLGGQSPSLVLFPAVLLSDLFPEIPLKDLSDDSFPGDHATILFAWIGFVLHNNRQWSGWAIACTSLVFALPRLFSGAHWLSDLLVGGLVVALPVLGWTYFSPIVQYLANTIAWMASPIVRRLANLPWFREQDFFRYASNHHETC